LTTGTISGTKGANLKFLAFEKTAKFALRKAISISPAISESRPEKIIWQSVYAVGTQRRIIRFATCAGIGVDCFQRTTSEYFLSADFSEAPTATSSNSGC
jgi:hypothetical protein